VSADGPDPVRAVARGRDRPTVRVDTHNRVTAVAFLVLIGMLGFSGGLPGLVVGIGTVAVWYALGLPYAVAAGHVALIAVFLDGISSVDLALVEVAFMAPLLASIRRVSTPLQTGIVALAVGSLLGGTAWFVLASRSLWLAASAVVVLFMLVGYAVHRYELVQLGLVSDRSRNAPANRTEVTDER